VAASWPRWRGSARSRRGALAIGAFAVGFAALFAPLALKQVTDPQIAKRAAITWVWTESDPLLARIRKVLARYPAHFGPGFLFVPGDPAAAYSPPDGYGSFFWSVLPLMAIGLAVAARGAFGGRALASASSRAATGATTSDARSLSMAHAVDESHGG